MYLVYEHKYDLKNAKTPVNWYIEYRNNNVELHTPSIKKLIVQCKHGWWKKVKITTNPNVNAGIESEKNILIGYYADEKNNTYYVKSDIHVYKLLTMNSKDNRPVNLYFKYLNELYIVD